MASAGTEWSIAPSLPRPARLAQPTTPDSSEPESLRIRQGQGQRTRPHLQATPLTRSGPTHDLVDNIRRVAPDGVDRIVEVALGENLPVSLQVLKQAGLIVTYAAETKDPVIATRPMMTLNVLLRYLLIYFLTPEQTAAAVADIQRGLKDGRLRQHLPVRVMPIDEIAAAQDLVQANTYGRILIDPNS